MNRRFFLKLVLSVPVLGALALFVSPLVRFMRPTVGPVTQTALKTGEGLQDFESWNGSGGLFTPPDMPLREADVIFDLSEFPSDWSFKTFTFGQKSREYSFKQFQSIRIPGFVVRLPGLDEVGNPKFIAVSRICPHMGCVFNFVPKEKCGEYNYDQATNHMFACPCHLSVFDPLRDQSVDGERKLGKVVSGPAPRPPRSFEKVIQNGKLIITAVEAGGIS